MKKHIKYASVALIIMLSGFIISTNSITSKHKEVTKAKPITTLNKKVKSNKIERYPKTKTEKVSHKLDSLLQRINKRHDFHGSLLVAKNGKIVYNNQVGYADFKNKELLNEASVFQLASVSKQFTATAIMLLYERNQIKLTDTVNKYFPNFPYEHVTITNLLNHTAGLPKYFWVAEHEWEQEKSTY